MPTTVLNVDHLHKRDQLGKVDRNVFQYARITRWAKLKGCPICSRAIPPARPTGPLSPPIFYCHTGADVRRVVATMNRF